MEFTFTFTWNFYLRFCGSGIFLAPKIVRKAEKVENPFYRLKNPGCFMLNAKQKAQFFFKK